MPLFHNSLHPQRCPEPRDQVLQPLWQLPHGKQKLSIYECEQVTGLATGLHCQHQLEEAGEAQLCSCVPKSCQEHLVDCGWLIRPK